MWAALPVSANPCLQFRLVLRGETLEANSRSCAWADSLPVPINSPLYLNDGGVGKGRDNPYRLSHALVTVLP